MIFFMCQNQSTMGLPRVLANRSSKYRWNWAIAPILRPVRLLPDGGTAGVVPHCRAAGVVDQQDADEHMISGEAMGVGIAGPCDGASGKQI
jgi:hypothetical protein